MVTVLSSGVSSSLLMGGPEEDYLRMCAQSMQQSLQQSMQHHQPQVRAIYLQGNHNHPGHPGHSGHHRYNAKAAAIIHRCQMKNSHTRSQSMPEDAYAKHTQLQQQQQQQLQQQQQQQQQYQQPQSHARQAQGLPQPQAPSVHDSGSGSGPYSQTRQEKKTATSHSAAFPGTNLRRSHTNAADLGGPGSLGGRLPPAHHFGLERQRLDASTTSLNLMAARSRSNIAALNWTPADSELQLGRSGANLSRTTSFYHRDYLQAARSLGFIGPTPKDLGRPLHVDCSVEYDLGNQPKIPKNSAPLLIIHPAYRQRYQPYSPTANFVDGTDYFGSDRRQTSGRPGLRHAVPRLPGVGGDSGLPGQTRLEFELTQSAPPKPQHRVTRHSSFLVGGNVSSRQLSTQFRPVVPEDESLYFNYRQVRQSPVPCVAGLEVPGTADHDPFRPRLRHRQNVTVKRSKSVHPTSKGFHLSMPDISLDEGIAHFRQQMALRTNGQHQHPRSRARANLELKLDAARKMSTESNDSGTSLEMMPSFVDDCILSPIVSPPKSDSGTALQSQAFSDSGLGTPSSLMDQDGTDVGTSCSSSTGSSVSKWKSSVTGFIIGMICCPTSGLVFGKSKRSRKVGKQALTDSWTNRDEIKGQETVSVSSACWTTSSLDDSHSLEVIYNDVNSYASSSSKPFRLSSSLSGLNQIKSKQRWELEMKPSFQRKFPCSFCRSRFLGDDCCDGFCSRDKIRTTKYGVYI